MEVKQMELDEEPAKEPEGDGSGDATPSDDKPAEDKPSEDKPAEGGGDAEKTD